MSGSRRWKRLMLLGAGSATLATILWAGYVFLAIWLRTRCARELAARSQPMPVIADELVADDSLNTSAIWFLAGTDNGAIEPIVNRLEELQGPLPRGLFLHLFRRGDGQTAVHRYEVVQSVAFSAQGTLLATSESDKTVRIWDASVSVQEQANDGESESDSVVAVTPDPSAAQVSVVTDGSVSLNASGNINVTAGRAIDWLTLGVGVGHTSYTVTDSAGEVFTLVAKPRDSSAEDAHVSNANPKPEQDLLLIDSGGNIIGRYPTPAGRLLGRLVQPQGTADQLVFGSQSSFRVNENGEWLTSGPVVICIIEHGELKIVRSVPARRPSSDEQGPP